MTTLYIAEKPTLARAIAEGIGISASKAGYIQCKNDTVVTWGFGHMLRQYNPEQYDAALKSWTDRTLPFNPEQYNGGWKVVPKEDSGVKKQLGIIKKFLAGSTLIVNAGDPDREGQLLIDEVLEYYDNRLPVKRIWLASLDPKSVSKALASLQDNNKYIPLKNAALARSRADWLVGLNLTRAMTIAGRNQGLNGSVLSIGRVQTPTLALVVQRDREIENFKPVSFYVPKVSFQHGSGINYDGFWIPNEANPNLDPENRLLKKEFAEEIVTGLKGQSGVIVESRRDKKQTPPPLPYSLSKLQKEASARFSMGAQKVLSTAQSLYEQKLTTYPRSDCQYLPEEQLSDAGEILNKLMACGYQNAGNANPSLKSAAWNTGKVTAHHAIIPTGIPPKGLSGDQQNLYDLIAESYIRLFFPAMEYLSLRIVTKLAGELWESKGVITTNPGWTVVGRQSEKKETPLPVAKVNDPATCIDAAVVDKETKPPARFTEGSLIEAMSSVHKFVENPELKARLKENSGIGTEATRAGILEILFKREYLFKKGKQVISSKLGRTLIDVTPKVLADPGTTALWEDYLSQIAEGKSSLKEFMDHQTGMLPKLVDIALHAEFPKSVVGEVHKCPECGLALQRKLSTKTKRFFWVCFEKGSHRNNEPVFLPDDNGKPGQPVEIKISVCPQCGGEIKRLQKKDRSGWFWLCENAKGHTDKKTLFLPDDNGKPGQPVEIKISVCPQCGGEIKRLQKKDKSSWFWLCENTKGHTDKKKLFLPDDNGKPGQSS